MGLAIEMLCKHQIRIVQFFALFSRMVLGDFDYQSIREADRVGKHDPNRVGNRK